MPLGRASPFPPERVAAGDFIARDELDEAEIGERPAAIASHGGVAPNYPHRATRGANAAQEILQNPPANRAQTTTNHALVWHAQKAHRRAAP